MQPEPPDRAPSGSDNDSLSQGNKRRTRTSERATRTTEDRESANAPPMGRRTLSTSSPQHGSSRDMTPPESAGSIKYTRTGRVSKATKGQRVHHCDECGKTYTRAEHLRRHQQNHKPGAFPCDVPGCSRSFYREDLLIRHKARHNDPNYSPSGHASPSSQDSTSVDRIETIDQFLPLSRRSTLGQSPAVISNETAPVDVDQRSRHDQFPGASTSSHKNHPTLTQGSVCPLPATVGSGPGFEPAFGGWQWDPSSPYSPSRYSSPINGTYYPSSGTPYFQPPFNRDRHASDASYNPSYTYPQASRSPGSAGSSTIQLPLQWGQTAHDLSFQPNSTPYGSDDTFQKDFDLYIGQMAQQQVPVDTFDAHCLLTPEDRDLMEQNDLLVPTSSPHGSSLDLTLDELNYSNEGRYLGAYWRWIHPFFPVVHQPSFDMPAASPLLRAAMLALGAHALHDSADKRNARIIHERCVKVVKKRTLNWWHSFRTCDMQAIFLMEIYSIFKSRRPPLQLSKIFQEVYQTLANDVAAVTGEIQSDPIQASSTIYLDEMALLVDVKCRQRLFLACYVLDQQHAMLFGRQRTSCYDGVGTDLPFPRTQASWDAANAYQAEKARHRHVWEALDCISRAENGHQAYDVFQSMLIMASLADGMDLDNLSYTWDANTCTSPILSMMESSPRAKMAYHTFMLCKNTPVRELLGVAGESWVMAEKLSTQTEYTAAQIETRHWARGAMDSPLVFDAEPDRATVSSAVQHALKILELHLDHPKTGLLFQEWAVYLASVVLWARAHVIAGKLEQGLRLSVANPPERRLSLHELDLELPNLLSAASKSEINIEQAKTIILWAKARIETVDIPHNCGLTNCALDVLGRLATKGGEEGWFGS